MSSEIRVNSLSSRAGLSTVTFTDTGPIFSGITTFQDNSGFNVGTGGSIFSPASNTVTLGTNNAERLRIDSAGRMLLGTTTEGESNADTLTIAESGNAGITIRSGSSATGSIYFSDATSGGGEYDGWIAYNQNSRYFQFGTAQTERLRITSAGLIGIGENNPSTSLHVAGSLTLEEASATGNAWTYYKNADRTWLVGVRGSSNDVLSFYDLTADVERLRITSAGRVGVNIDSPNTVLHIKSTQNSDGLTVTKGSNVSAFLGHNGSGDEGLFTLKEGGTTKIQLYAETGQNSYINSGNFGLGETSPYYKLHLKTNNNATSLSGGSSGNWGGDGIRIENENTTVGSMVLAHFRNYDADWHIGGKYNSSNNSDFIFSTESNERLRITSDGKMGVGTASPNHRLTLHNSGTGTFDALNITSGLTNAVGLQLGIDSASNVFLWHTANGGIKFATNNVERMRVTNNGLTFNGDTAADNALDDYEQGTWNPTIAFGGSSTGVSYSERQGIYVKIGSLVWASIVISLTNNGSGTGDVSITLPFTVGSNSENRGIGTLAYFAGFAGLNSNPNIYASSGGSTTCRLQHLNNGGGGNGTQVTTLTHGNISNTAGIRGAIMYTTI